MLTQTTVNLFSESTFIRQTLQALAHRSERDILVRENLELRQERGYWKSQHSRAKERIEQLEEENRALKGKIKYLERKLYGRKTEQGGPADEKIEQEPNTGEGAPRARGQQPGQPGHGREKV